MPRRSAKSYARNRTIAQSVRREQKRLRLARLLGQGQAYVKNTALARLGLGPDMASIVAHDLAADGQAQACALACVVHGVAVTHLMKLVKDGFELAGRNADAGIAHDHEQGIVLPADAQMHAPGRRELDRVL